MDKEGARDESLGTARMDREEADRLLSASPPAT